MPACLHGTLLTSMQSCVLRALPAALMIGFSVMAAEIHDAVRAGDAAAVARLLKKNPKLVNLTDDAMAATPLYHAVDTSNLELVKVLLDAGAKVNVKTTDGMTPMLRAAAIINPVKALEYLLEQGADPEVSALGFRPLHFAVKWGNAEVVKALIAHKADVNAAQVPAVDPPLHVAVFGGNMEIIRLLLDHGAKVNALGRNGSTALHHATWNDEIFHVMLERGADPKLQQSHGVTTLHMACQDGSAALVAKLLQLHPDLDAWDGAEFTPLLNAAEAGRVDLLKLLIAAGADLKAVQKNGRNALHLAAGAANPEAVRFLLEQKLQVNALSNSGDTAHGGTPLHLAVMDKKLGAARILLDHGAPPNARDQYQNSPLMLAATVGSVEMVRLLLDHRALVKGADAQGNTPLHNAAMVRVGRNEITPPAGEPEANTQLALNAINNCPAADKLTIVKLLLAKGARPQAKNLEGATPVDFAEKFGTPEILATLKSNTSRPPGK
jgi:ankyrin